MKKILVIDNYDSFTYNLVHYVNEFPEIECDVFRNDMISFEEIEKYDGIILSPGPGIPSEAGNLLKIIDHFKLTKRIFGVCLGLQAIAEVFGGQLLNTKKVYHGVATNITILGSSHYLFDSLPDQFPGGRYHSWVVNSETVPEILRVDAVDEQGYIMAMSHKELDICGVQFHPESILTPNGKQIVFNWLKEFDKQIKIS